MRIASVLLCSLILTTALAVGSQDASRTTNPSSEPGQAALTKQAWFTEEQASRGRTHYAKQCASCHGADFVPDDFSPGLTGAAFDWRWKTRTVYDLYDTTRSTMPPDAAGSLDAATALEIVAHLLKANGFPAGSTALEAAPARLRQMPLVRPVP